MSAKGSFRAWLSAWAPALPLFAVVLFGLLAPTAFLMLRSVVADGQLSLDLWSKMLGLRNVQRGIITSLELGLVCATIATVVGVPLAWLVSRTLPVRRSLWLGIFNVAAHFGGIGLAFAYVVTLGTFGMITLLINSAGPAFDPPPRDSFAAIVMTMQYSSVPLLVLLLVPAMGMLREQWWEAAQTSSASRLQFWRRIGLPVLMPFVAAGFVLVFTWTIGSYTVPYALAGQSPAQPVQLITLQIGLTLSDDVITGPARAGVLSIVLMALAVVALLGYRMLIRRGLRWFTGTADDQRAARRLHPALLAGGPVRPTSVHGVRQLVQSRGMGNRAGHWTRGASGLLGPGAQSAHQAAAGPVGGRALLAALPRHRIGRAAVQWHLRAIALGHARAAGRHLCRTYVSVRVLGLRRCDGRRGRGSHERSRRNLRRVAVADAASRDPAQHRARAGDRTFHGATSRVELQLEHGGRLLSVYADVSSRAAAQLRDGDLIAVAVSAADVRCFPADDVSDQ